MSKIRRNEYTDFEWYRGNLSWMLRPHGQTWIHDFILDRWQAISTEEITAAPIVVNAHRRVGKSFLNVVTAVEQCLRAPDQQWKYVCGEKEQVREIIEPLMAQILVSAPEDIRPKTRGYKYRFRNPAWEEPGESFLSLVGANYRKGDMGRGTACDGALMDEVRDFNDLPYFFESVLAHQFVGRKKPLAVMTTTIPWSLDHPFCRPGDGYMDRARRVGRYLEVRASQNPDYTERDKKLVLAAIGGGEDDPSYRREAECEMIGDANRLITPEYQDHRDKLILTHYERPAIMQPHVCMDTGFIDQTAILFGYLDWVAQVLVFEAEVVKRYMTTLDIVESIKAMVQKLGYDKMGTPIRYIADMEPRGIEDLRRAHHLSFTPPIKHQEEQSMAAFRARIATEQIRIILPACKELDYQLMNGIWTDDKHTKIQRTSTLGHWDAGKAAVYLNRMINWGVTPYKFTDTTRSAREQRPTITGTREALLRALGRRRF